MRALSRGKPGDDPPCAQGRHDRRHRVRRVFKIKQIGAYSTDVPLGDIAGVSYGSDRLIAGPCGSGSPMFLSPYTVEDL